MTNNDLEQAIQLFFENPDLQHSINSASATTQTATRNAPSGTHRQAVREDEHGVIHIDSDDEDEDVDSVQAVARNAQEEEDAAMAQRLQEELFSAPNDEIRSPIRSTTETLVAPHPAWGSGFDGDDDIQSDLLEQLRQRQARASKKTDLHPLTRPPNRLLNTDDVNLLI